MRILTKLKPIEKNTRKIFAFDVETKQIKRDTYIEQQFICGSVVGDGIEPFFSKDKKEIADFLLSNRLRDSYIYATNLEFDFMHIFQDDKRMKDMFMIDKDGIIYCAYKKNTHKHHFIDTWNYTKISVSKMGDLIGLPKLPSPSCFLRLPKDPKEWHEMKTYNIRDSEITYNFAKFFCDDFCSSIGAKPKITLASTGQDYWRRNHQPVDIFQERRHIIEKHFEGSLHGGRTECFQRGLFDFKLYYYDFNSHYPACCHDGIDGHGTYPNPSSSRNTKDMTEAMIDKYEGITKVDITAPYMHIPVLGITNEDGKYIFPVGKIKDQWFTNIELRYAFKYGYKIDKIHEGVYYSDNIVPFREAVKEVYSLRQKYKKEGNNAMQLMVKVLMNSSLFGKFAQKIDSKTEIYNIQNLYAEDNGHVYIKKNDKKVFLKDFVQRGNFIFERIKRPLRIPIFIMPIFSSYTTAIARLRLHKHLMKSPSAMVYCDTDSIVCMKDIFETSSRLGDLKLEYKIDNAVFIKPKFYYINAETKDIIKSKGLGRINKKEDFDSLLKSRVSKMTRFTKLKESYVRNFPYSSIIDIVKNISLEDDKRCWKYPFSIDYAETSRPLDISS